MTAGDSTIQAEGNSDFFQEFSKKGPNVSEKMAKIDSKNLAELLISQQILIQQLLLEILKM